MSEKFNVVILKSAWSIESASPACLKLLAWLKMTGIDHQVSSPKMAPKSKTGKAPYIEFEDGTILPDSQRAIEYLSQKHNVQLDAHLSDLQRAQTLCLRRLLEDHLYFILVYQRWAVSFDEVRAAYFSTLPFAVRSIVPFFIQKKVKKDLLGQGTGKRPYEEIMMEARADIDAISTLLGTQDFFFGQPSSIDAVVFGTLENILNVPLKCETSAYIRDHENLVAFCARFRAKYF